MRDVGLGITRKRGGPTPLREKSYQELLTSEEHPVLGARKRQMSDSAQSKGFRGDRGRIACGSGRRNPSPATGGIAFLTRTSGVAGGVRKMKREERD